ncbi:MAG: orotidine-5'-phosphate decarboxylase [Planctomycetota bacterium]
MGPSFVERLKDRVARVGSAACVGLDPVLERLPASIAGASPADRIEAFCLAVVEATCDQAACFKPQWACFERYGSAGIRALESVTQAARATGALVIADAKRGDIGVSSAHYAEALFSGEAESDAGTVSPYLGGEAITPLLDAAGRGKGLFVLVRTSNPGAGELQGLVLDDGRSVAQAVADRVSAWGKASVDATGYSGVGAVVGATAPGEAAELRQRMPDQVFLVPGFGAQGGTVDTVAPCFDAQGRGAIVNASRSVLYAFEGGPGPWQSAVSEAAARFGEQVERASAMAQERTAKR